MNRWSFALALAVVVAITRGSPCHRDGAAPFRIATFNIENFPKNAAQVEGAFDEIARLDAGIVGLQEIGDPALFARAAKRRLGRDWRCIFLAANARTPVHHNGVLFDERRFAFVSTRAHDDTRLDGGHKPTLEVRLRDRHDDEIVRVLVVHLKAGADGRAIRAQQYAALARIVGRSHERTVLLGDFNATDDAGDRDDLARLAARSNLAWGTERLACSAFWQRDDGCFRSRLDHVLSSTAPAAVELGGACATHGCDREDSCPIYVEHVSDHCPVVIELPSAR